MSPWFAVAVVFLILLLLWAVSGWAIDHVRDWHHNRTIQNAWKDLRK